MKQATTTCGVFLAATLAAADLPSPETQIIAAVLAAPPDLREGVAVCGYNAPGELVQLRGGKNEYVHAEPCQRHRRMRLFDLSNRNIPGRVTCSS